MRNSFILTLAVLPFLWACNKDLKGDIGEHLSDIQFRKVCYEAFDTDGDGVISASEANAASVLRLTNSEHYPSGFYGCDPWEIEGLKYFPNLEEFRYQGTYLKRLDFSSNKKLKTLILSSYSLQHLSLPSPCRIEVLELIQLQCITEFTVPASVQSLFLSNCYNLEKLEFEKPSGLKTILSSGLLHTNLTELYLPEGLEVIEQDAAKNTKFQVVDLPSTIKAIGKNAFTSCTAMKYIVIRAATPPEIVHPFDGATYSILVPPASLSLYKERWPQYESRLKAYE